MILRSIPALKSNKNYVVSTKRVGESPYYAMISQLNSPYSSLIVSLKHLPGLVMWCIRFANFPKILFPLEAAYNN